MRNSKTTTISALLTAVLASSFAAEPALAQGGSQASPAAAPIPETVTPQTFADELIETGRVRFASDCGFCHGRDAAGGTGGTDLTRSALVAEDVGGNLIGDVVRTGRLANGMPAFTTMADGDLEAIVAFIHTQKLLAESATGGRRSVEVADLQTGSARAGARYFERHCTSCHSASGDLADVGTRFEGLALLRRMLYPGSEGRSAAPRPARPRVTVVLGDGRQVNGALTYADEFSIALIDDDGRYRSWPTRSVEFSIDDPLQVHVAQLARYTDDDIHDVFAFMQSLTEQGR